jgi:glycosyltransferase involved in cell wall biosynthesis
MHSGGVEKGTLEVARALVEAGHRSIVISAGGRMVEALQQAGSEHIAMAVGRKGPTTLALIPKLRTVLRENNVNVLHARSRVPAWLSVLALKWFGHDRPAFVTTVHGLYSVNRFSKIMTRGDRVICVSKTVRDYVLSNYPDVEPNRLELIYRGVEPAEYCPSFQVDADWERQFRSQYQLASRPLILLPGRLTRLKGHMDFLKLMEALQATGSPAMGLIVGGEDPRRMGYARELREAADGVPNVVMTGHRSDLRNIMSISSVVVSLSNKPESFGRTVLEALSLGTPVVGYEHGGVGEILGQLFPEGRVPVGGMAGLIEAVQTQLKSAQATSIASNSLFTLSQMLAQTLELYTAVGRAQ